MRSIRTWRTFFCLTGCAVIAICGVWLTGAVFAAAPPESALVDQYVVLAWNDLGMHCYNRSFQDLAVLPPFNTLWAQVVRIGDPPQIITQGIQVTYVFTDNTYSVHPVTRTLKTDFWEYEDRLFGVNLPDNVGLAGKGVSGNMDSRAWGFEAVGIPLTEFRDSSPTTPYPFQTATVVVRDSSSLLELARTTVVAPVSTEMRCDNCHSAGKQPGGSYSRTELNILAYHDAENAGEYPRGHTGRLMNRRPILCAECHASNALGAKGVSGLPSLANAMHSKHAGIIPDTMDGCYNCHPGPQTLCLRDVMSQAPISQTCIDCHGGMTSVAANATPWLKEPICVKCHPTVHATGFHLGQNQALYRNSQQHGGLYCEACHDSPHAIAPSREANDGLKFIALQGTSGTLAQCTVCHLTQPASGGPHSFGFQQAAPILVKRKAP